MQGDSEERSWGQMDIVDSAEAREDVLHHTSRGICLGWKGGPLFC